MSKVYFLGAGATKAVAPGAPLNEELLNEAIENIGNYPTLKLTIKETKLFIDRIFHRNKTFKPKLEDILSFIDYNLRNKATTIRLYNYDQLLKIRNNIIRIIGAVLERTLRNLNYDATSIFASKIRKHDVVISTNYDIVIDNVLSESGNTNYGVRLRKNVLPIEVADGTMVGGVDISNLINQGSIKLLKIHGSLNWLYCQRCDEIDITVGNKGAARYLGKELSVFCSNSSCTCQYEPLIVTPTKFKIYENRILKEVWNMAKESIKHCSEIIFIGYSLPEADTEIRCLLLNGFNESLRKPKITFVDDPKGSKDIDNYRSLFGPVKYLPIGFVEYANRLN